MNDANYLPPMLPTFPSYLLNPLAPGKEAAHDVDKSIYMNFKLLINFILFYVVDVVTPEEQEQVFAASVHNLSKVAAILLKECTVK